MTQAHFLVYIDSSNETLFGHRNHYDCQLNRDDSFSWIQQKNEAGEEGEEGNLKNETAGGLHMSRLLNCPSSSSSLVGCKSIDFGDKKREGI